jgi:hypothetical protein
MILTVASSEPPLLGREDALVLTATEDMSNGAGEAETLEAIANDELTANNGSKNGDKNH